MAFIFINSKPGAEEELMEELKEIPEVKEAHMIFGVYDIIARVEAVNKEALKGVINRIRHLEKVKSTLTMVCM